MTHSTATRVLLLAWAAILVLGPLAAWDVRAQPIKMVPVAEGTGRAGEFPTKWAIYITPEAAPGDNIAAVESIIGAIGAGKVGSLTSFSFYFAGIEGRTLHLYRVEFKDLKEQTRHPILLPIAADNTALLRMRPYTPTSPSPSASK